ncbi:MAG: cobalamin-dependent protein, partial [Tabrizicola sp.]
QGIVRYRAALLIGLMGMLAAPLGVWLAHRLPATPLLLGMSALLTTTMPYMKVVIDTMKEKGLRDDYIVLVGGAPLNEEFGKAIGADAYCRDAAVAVETAKQFVSRKHNQLNG